MVYIGTLFCTVYIYRDIVGLYWFSILYCVYIYRDIVCLYWFSILYCVYIQRYSGSIMDLYSIIMAVHSKVGDI